MNKSRTGLDFLTEQSVRVLRMDGARGQRDGAVGATVSVKELTWE